MSRRADSESLGMAPLTQDHWDQLPLPEAEAAARGIESRLGGRFNFHKISRCTQAGVSHQVAFFLRKDCLFALVLQATGRLGWTPQRVENVAELYARDHEKPGWNHPVELTLQSFGCETARDIAPPQGTCEEWLKYVLTPPRQIPIPNLLVAVEAQPAHELAGLDNESRPLAEINRILASDGFRLPSSDEWEHLSNAGSPDLFRWGNVWPTLDDFSGHLDPNAFGLVFTADPYCPEYVSEEHLMRAGDGGEMICGGIGPLAWLTFASSYVCRSPSILEDPEIWVFELEPLEIP